MQNYSQMFSSHLKFVLTFYIIFYFWYTKKTKATWFYVGDMVINSLFLRKHVLKINHQPKPFTTLSFYLNTRTILITYRPTFLHWIKAFSLYIFHKSLLTRWFNISCVIKPENIFVLFLFVFFLFALIIQCSTIKYFQQSLGNCFVPICFRKHHILLCCFKMHHILYFANWIQIL
jgi:hypothetical protein